MNGAPTEIVTLIKRAILHHVFSKGFWKGEVELILENEEHSYKWKQVCGDEELGRSKMLSSVIAGHSEWLY